MTRSAALAALAATTLVAACSGMPMRGDRPAAGFRQDSLPAPVQVPAGHKVALETVGVGRITYECRESTTMAGRYEWVFAGPDAALNDRGGRTVGRYYGPPATWEAADGSKITGTQVAVAPAGGGNIPLQLVKANPASGMGAMNGVSYIQRVRTMGGVAPASACGAETRGAKEVVQYQADYIFWSPA